MCAKKLSIIIPAYNEARTIHLILDKVNAVQLIGGFEKEIIIAKRNGTIFKLWTILTGFVLLVAAEFTVEMVTAGTVAYVPVKV